jgi:hypothetical protein
MQNSGTLISSAIRPNDSLDQIASAFANEIKGGAHGYETYIDMYNIIVARREWGMLVNVYNDPDPVLNGTYQLKYGNTGDNVFDISDNSNWVKINLGESTSTEWVDSVISILSVEPTLEPFPGHRYLLGTTPGLQPQGINWGNYSEGTIIVEYSNIGTWKITFPTNGMTVRVDNDDNSIYKYEGIYPTGIWKKEKITQVFYIEPTSVGGLTYSVSTDPIFNSYSSDLIFLTKFNTPNNGTASLNINGLGFKDIKVVTKSGVRDLIITDIMTDGFYSLTYNGTYFQMTKPFTSDAYNIKYRIRAGEVITVEEFEQYWVYGDLTIDEGGVIENYGKVIIANGLLYNDGEMNLNGVGELISVDLTNTITYNPTDTIQLSETMTVNGPSVSAIVKNNSLTPSHINSVNIPTAGYLLSNDGESFEWIAPAGTAYTANNGLTESPTNNFQLGGTLIKNTTITNSNLYNLSVTGSLNGNALFKVNNPIVTFFEDPSTYAIRGDAESGIAVVGVSVDNYGVLGRSKNSIGVRAEADANFPLVASGNYTTAAYFRVDNNTAGVLDVIKIARASNGFQGVGFSLETNVSGGTIQVSNRFQSIFTDGNLATRTSQLAITSLNNAVESTTLTLKGTGQLQLNKYTGGTFDSTATKSLGVDASGNVITFTTGGGSVSISGSASYIPKFTGTSSLGNSNFIDNGSSGSYNGANSDSVTFIPGSNEFLRLFRTQSSMNFILGNPQSPNFQIGQIKSQNTLGFDLSSQGYLSFSTGPSYSEAMRISTNGYVGIGLTGPSSSLHIFATQSGAFRLEDGTQGVGKVLISDANGVASWTSSVSVSVATASILQDIFYNLGGTVSATNSTSAIYRTGALSIGTGSVTTYGPLSLPVEGRFTVSSSTGTVSLVVDESGNIFNDSINGNTKFGFQALNSATSSLLPFGGQSSVAIGYNALYSCTSGILNTAVGYGALLNNTTASGNVAVGANTLSQNTIGYNNVAVGTNALNFNTTGYNNVIVGNSALGGNTTGYYNIALGYQSGTIISGTGDINTGTGATNSDSSIFIGYFTCPSTASNTNEIVIGHGATGNGSNSVTLGNDNITKTYLKGNVQLPTVPTTSAGTYSILTRNNITGEVEKIAPAYKVYTALLTQSGTASPTVDILENTLGGTIVWTRSGIGSYTGTLSGMFPDTNKVFCIFSFGTSVSNYGDNINLFWQANSSNTIVLTTVRINSNSDEMLSKNPIEIRVYN